MVFFYLSVCCVKGELVRNGIHLAIFAPSSKCRQTLVLRVARLQYIQQVNALNNWTLFLTPSTTAILDDLIHLTNDNANKSK